MLSPNPEQNSVRDREDEDVLTGIRKLVAADMEAVNAVIQNRLHSDVVLINQLGEYIVGSGGKRLRPTLVLLSAHACGYQGRGHVDAAAIIEFIHTATLLHDDVVDASQMRRGRETANTIWGNEASVLVGDFLYSRAFEMMVEVGSMRVMEIMARTTNVIAEGEVLQLLNCHNPDTTAERYMQVIRCKTAQLFSAACQIGAVLAGKSPAMEQQLRDYGMHLGTAYQLVDDVLDYSGSLEAIGKNIGDDLAEGKPTLPLIYALQHADRSESALIRRAVEEGSRVEMQAVMDVVHSSGAIGYTRDLAEKESQLAVSCLAGLPTSPFRQALELTAQFAVRRSH